MPLHLDFTEKIQHIALATSAQLSDERKTDLGQFYTATKTAEFMSSLFSPSPVNINLLDPSAGSGMLTALYINNILAKKRNPSTLVATALKLTKPCMELCAKLWSYAQKRAGRTTQARSYNVIFPICFH
jgi:hypothetical protein